MSYEAQKCNVKGCKGFVVFENADFDLQNPDTIKGFHAYGDPKCTECGKEYLIIPHYVVVDPDSSDFDYLDTACITDWEQREKELNFENETDPYEKIKKFIQLRRYTYSFQDVIEGFAKQESGYYVSHSMKDCIENLRPEIKSFSFGM